MKKTTLILTFLILLVNNGFSQKGFTVLIDIDNTPMKNQQRTGTCWSFATASYLEAEVLRITNKSYHLSEMYQVRNIYSDKATNYFLRQGKANFSEGAVAHDFIRAVASNGVVPESVFDGKPKDEAIYNHTEFFKVIEGYVKGAVSSKLHTDYWKDGFDAILDVYIGKLVNNFEFEGKKYTPKEFAIELGINPKNYIELTSFVHHPFYKYFVLEIPDNYSSGLYYNIKISELKAQTDFALENGYSVSWDGDASESGFGRKSGIIELEGMDSSIVEKGMKNGNYKAIVDLRQKQFESLKTTDDHLMHIVGKVKDQNDKLYYIVKNSWGDSGKYHGYYYMSEEYFYLKTIAIMIHKNALMKNIKPSIYIPNALY